MAIERTSPAETSSAGTVLTIGHSSHPLDVLLNLLQQHGVDLVIDVRSNPHSAYAPQFDKPRLEDALTAHRIDYEYLGDLLGGMPPEDEFYDGAGHVLYDRLAQSRRFQRGIEIVVGRLAAHRPALLCGEEDPAECHRRLLIARVLRERGVEARHIRGDGRIETEAQIRARKTKGQGTLFDMQELEPWKSTQSVSPKKAPPNSSPR